MDGELPRAFAASQELDRAVASGAAIKSYPHPSRLGGELSLPGAAGEGAQALGLHTLGDLLEHFPHTHRDRREVRQIATVGVGEEATIEVTIKSIAVRPMRNRRQKRVEARAGDESGPVVAVWFNQPWIARQLGEGSRVRLHGTAKQRNQFWVTEHESLGAGQAGVHTSGLVPVYPATEKLGAAKIRELIAGARELIHDLIEPLPAAVRLAERLLDRPAAVDAMHFPEDPEHQEEARRRLAFEELFLLELALAARRRSRVDTSRAESLTEGDELIALWLADLPFAPTGDQEAAFAAIDRDLAAEHPMQRLLMGEVGTGKTAVALHAMLRAVGGGRQAVLMAPTETLAEQHLITIDSLLGGLTPIALLTGSTPAAQRREILGRLHSGELGLVVGTHALIEEPVVFRSLGLCVVDEQHRFGVRQRAALDGKAPEGLIPHVLHMTATPIPRTLALTAFGDLDVTVLRELPKGRRPVETFVVDGARARARAYERAREEIRAGRQAFVVCPLVEESETLQAAAATTEAERLSKTEFADHRVELIHGQMHSRDKQAAMASFAAGEADVLVATSVIEVGIDVPNASVMLIEAAERYGLSQLHQLRGRVGRGGHPSICILFGNPAVPRLEAIGNESDGFKLAEIDLELRGAGEVLGSRQSGLPDFKVARIPDDAELIDRARVLARPIVERDPLLEQPEHSLLRQAALDRFGPDLDPIPA
ncbi:MAG: ATP-dependent helicase RecG [Thermoleophilaceae bacterium]|nr:ATP-dependent helicase RecG [Thermoleophilaceae bacterium]